MDTYAIELIEEIDTFRRNCEYPELRADAQVLINQIRFNEITLASAERALASLEDKAEQWDEQS